MKESFFGSEAAAAQAVPGAEIANRLVSLQALLAKHGIDAAIIRQNADLYYFTGTVQDSHLIVPASGHPVFMVRRNVERAEAESPIRPVVRMKAFGELLDAVFDACGTKDVKRLGLELDVLPANAFIAYDEKVFPKQQIVDIGWLVRQVRMLKSPWEIGMMQEAGAINGVIADSAPRILREGITELELNAELEAVSHKAGSMGILRLRSFNLEMVFGHVLSGPNAAVPSYNDSPTGGSGLGPAFGQGSNSRSIRAGEVVTVDTITCWGGYMNDQTRSFCIGEPPGKLREAYRFVREVHERFRGIARPGAVTGRLYETVWQWAREAGWAEWFMGHADPRVSFVGHGIGVEVDEFPFLAEGQTLALEEGMTFAFEPKVIIPGIGMAGLENTYRVTAAGIESFNSAPEEMILI